MATAEEKSSRQQAILRMLEENPSLTTQDLAQELDVSLGTVRNDLVALEEMGNIRRSYGRIELLARQRRDSLLAVPDRFSRAARAIGNRMLSRLALLDRVFLDDSEPSHYVARNLPDSHEVHVLTNSVRVAATLAWRDHPGEITILPGAVQRRDLSVAVDLGDLLPKRYRVGAGFCEIAAIDEDGACYVSSREALELIRVVARMAETMHFHVRQDGVRRTGLHIVPMDEIAPTLAEIVMDDSNLTAVKEMNLDAVPAIVVGEDYAIAGPFRRKAVVGFSLVGPEREYPQTIRHSIEEAARATGGIELIVAENRGDRDSFLRNIDTFIEYEARVVIEYSPPTEIGPLAAEKLSHSGIALIGVDIPIPGSIYYGVNNYEAGFVAGEKATEFVVHEWPDSEPVVILVDMQDHNDAVISRLQGIEDSIRKRLGIQEDRIRRVSCPNDLDAAILELEPQLDTLDPGTRVLIFGFNAVATIAAYTSVHARDDRERFAVVGQNLSADIRKELHRPDSRLVGSVTYHPEEYGPQIMEIVRSILNNEPVGPSTFTTHEWVPASRLSTF